MKDIIEKIRDLGQIFFDSAEKLFDEPFFWLVIFAFCVILSVMK